jgi:hypothetical protein
MIKIFYILAIIILTTSLLKAQDTTKPFHFPHKTGDMWEYFYDDYSPLYVDTLQNFTIFDSTESNGIIIMKQHAQFINPITTPAVLEDTSKYWIDTVNNYVWGPDKDQSDSSLIYKLDVNKGEQWVVSNFSQIGGSDFQIARVINKWEDTLFNKPTTFINISYFIAKDSTDTTGIIDLGYDEIADRFGLVARGGGDSPGEIHLIGAVINDTLYGDTILTSIKNNKIILPTSIKLYQNYPNPFNPTTTIQYTLPLARSPLQGGARGGLVTLKVYDILGREIATLVNEEQKAGNYKVEFNGANLSSGVYFYQLRAGNYTATKKLLLLK